MAATSTVANKIKYLMVTKGIDFSSDTFKCCLMASGFVFDKDVHHYYADVSAYEVADGNGYTTGGATMTGVSVTEDDDNDYTNVAWSDPTWTASSGNISAIGAIVYDDTASYDPIVGYIDFGETATTVDGRVFTITAVKFRVA
jgi:hypothetical protein